MYLIFGFSVFLIIKVSRKIGPPPGSEELRKKSSSRAAAASNLQIKHRGLQKV